MSNKALAVRKANLIEITRKEVIDSNVDIRINLSIYPIKLKKEKIIEFSVQVKKKYWQDCPSKLLLYY